jgi:hypothetical protein
MTRSDKNRLKMFLVNAFLHRYLAASAITPHDGTYVIDAGKEEELEVAFYCWWIELISLDMSPIPAPLIDAIHAIGCDAVSGRSEFLSLELLARNRVQKLMPRDPLILPEQPNPMEGEELAGGVTKEDVRALLAGLAKPWHL